MSFKEKFQGGNSAYFFLICQRLCLSIKKLGFKGFVSENPLVPDERKPPATPDTPFPTSLPRSRGTSMLLYLLEYLLAKHNSPLGNEGGCKAYSNFSFSTQYTAYKQC